VDGKGEPFQSIVEPLTNPVPVAEIVTAALPATAEAGLMELKNGVGFEVEPESDPEAPPPPQPAAATEQILTTASQTASRVAFMHVPPE
jgi:hypothetical protein